jgi:hypothetical protein
LSQLASKLEEILLTPDDRLVLDLLSNSTFMGTDLDGLPTASVQGEGGTYHIPGSLTVAPVPVTKKILANCSQIGKICSKVKHVTLISPIPRYVTGKCCDDNNHVENYDSDDFEIKIINGPEHQKRLLDVWAAEHQLCYRIVDATELVDPVEPILRNRVTRSGIPLWSTWDPVHLVGEAYEELAYAILSASDGDSGDGSDDVSCSSGGNTDQCYKRRRPDAVITTPLNPVSRGESMAGAPNRQVGCLESRIDDRFGRMTALVLSIPADPTVLGPTVLGTGGGGDVDGAGLAQESLAVGAPEDGERL